MALNQHEIRTLAKIKALSNRCESSCLSHQGNCVVACVADDEWWSYCQNAVNLDRAAGFKVETFDPETFDPAGKFTDVS